MDWLNQHRNWLVFNLLAFAALMFTFRDPKVDYSYVQPSDPGLETAKWAVRYLLICLSMTPLGVYAGWRSAVKLRKSAGLWSFGFAAAHIALVLKEGGLAWFQTPWQPFIAYGLAGAIVLTALAVTSNRWSMRRLGKNWKRLHKSVYLGGVVILAHALLATASSKKAMVLDPDAATEIKLYIFAFAVLMALRIPQVRGVLAGFTTGPRKGLAARSSLAVEVKPISHYAERAGTLSPWGSSPTAQGDGPIAVTAPEPGEIREGVE